MLAQIASAIVLFPAVVPVEDWHVLGTEQLRLATLIGFLGLILYLSSCAQSDQRESATADQGGRSM